VADRRTNLSLSALLLDRHLRVNLPVEAFTFLIALDKSLVLAKVVSHTGLPTACRGLELVPRIFSLDVAVYLLEVHLTGAGRRDGFVN
jgi:hypothetical protein